MNLSDTPEQAAFRGRLRLWLAENLPRETEPTEMAARFRYMIAWQKRLYAGGWVALSWPEEYGGQGLGPMEESILNEELGRAGAPATVSFGFLGRPLLEYGTEEQKRRYLPPFLASSEIWCQGFSEPDAGSDLASLQTRAVWDGDAWIIKGQKIWTSRACFANYCLVLARTGPSAARHRGITAFIVPMAQDAVSVRPLVMSHGDEEFGEVFFEDVRVPDSNRVGEVDQGWEVTQGTLTYERGAADLGYLAKYERMLGQLAAFAEHQGLADDASVCEQIGEVKTSLEVLRLHSMRRLSARLAGHRPGAETSVDKLLMTQTEQALLHAALEVIGSEAITRDDAPWFKRYLYSRAGSIYGGTSQIQRNIIARRVIGLK